MLRIGPVARRRAVIVALHLMLIPLGFLTAFSMRFSVVHLNGFLIPHEQLPLLRASVPILIGLRMLAFWQFGLFTGWLRHVGVQDLLMLLRAVVVSEIALVAVLAAMGFSDLPYVLFVLDAMIAVLLFGGLRMSVRLVREGNLFGGRSTSDAVPALIVGAGNAAARLLHSFHSGAMPGIRPVGLVDDDPGKRWLRIHGIPVLGNVDQLKHLVERHEPRLLVIAMPSATRAEMQRIVDRCMETRVEFKVVPSLEELLAGEARLSKLRNVQIEDLLGRPPVRLQMRQVEQDLADKVVLITGAAGSIGSELARQVGRLAPRTLILLEQAESPLYFTHLELRERYPHVEIVPIIADVTDRQRLRRVFADHRPDHVFHAAAYKHVPMMESNLDEAVRNNVFGTLNVAECATASGASKFVLISTDKAVRPSSIMGATKRVAEQITLHHPRMVTARTDCRVVRFGNVLGSDGSVIPLFKRQIAAGRPLTVTHRDVTRYFMTIPEAVQLVLQTTALPEASGRVSMLEMGQPVRILDLAEKLIRLSGLEPYRDIPIEFSGLRPGEKLHEDLVGEWEATIPTAVAKIRIVKTGDSEGHRVQSRLEALDDALGIGDRELILDALRLMVPDGSFDSMPDRPPFVRFRDIQPSLSNTGD
jgi:FlaA1/EpsC-like NDP-sugar epimerase